MKVQMKQTHKKTYIIHIFFSFTLELNNAE